MTGRRWSGTEWQYLDDGGNVVGTSRWDGFREIDTGAVGGGSAGPGVSVKSHGAKGDGVTDDTAAIVAAVDAVKAAGLADGTYYGEVVFPPGRYKVDGALTQGGATKGNALIPLPNIPDTGQKFTLVLRGAAIASGLWHWNQTAPQTGTACLITTKVGAQSGTYGDPCVIGGPTPEQGYGRGGVFSNILVKLDGLHVVLPNDPHINGVDLRGCANAVVEDLSVKANATPSTVAGPTAGWQVGLYMPDNDNNDLSIINRYTAQGMNFGVVTNEHCISRSIACVYCVAAVEHGRGGDTAHGALIDYLSAESCQVGLGAVLSGFASKVDVRRLDWEGGTGPWAGFAVINDATDRLLGSCRVTTVGTATHLQDGTGNFHCNGARNYRVYDDTRTPGQVAAPAVPASGAPLRNPMFRDCAVYIAGGAVTAIAVDGVTLGVTSGLVVVPTGKTVMLTYTAPPTWVWTVL